MLETFSRLLLAMVDVIGSNGWLKPALEAMEMSQMVTQAVWNDDSPLMQLPHFTKKIAKRCAAKDVEGVFDLLELDDKERDELTGFSKTQMSDVAKVCNVYPNIEMTYEVLEPDEVAVGTTVSVKVVLEREVDGDYKVAPVHAPYYSKPKDEGWWLVVANVESNELLSIKRINMSRAKMTAQLEFDAPGEAGEVELTLYFMSDSYTGCDQEYEFKVKVGEEEDSDDEGESEESSEEQESTKKRKEAAHADSSSKKQRKK